MRYGELRPRVAGCALRKRVLETHGWNFYGNEYTLLPMSAVSGSGRSAALLGTAARGHSDASIDTSGRSVVSSGASRIRLPLAAGNSSDSRDLSALNASREDVGLCHEMAYLMVFRCGAGGA